MDYLTQTNATPSTQTLRDYFEEEKNYNDDSEKRVAGYIKAFTENYQPDL